MRLLKVLYVQVLIAMALGIGVGALWPGVGVALKPLGDGFVALIRMLIAPVIFCTVASGIAHMSDLRRFGRVGLKALVYFEAVSTLALAAGLIVAEALQPGRGFNIDPRALDPRLVSAYVAGARSDSLADHLLAIIPRTFLGAFTDGDILQVLLLAILTGLALSRLPDLAGRGARALDKAMQLLFAILRIVVRTAPIGAFGAMGFTIGKYGLTALVRLGALVGAVYLASILFVVVALGLVARASGFSIFRFLAYIREELLIVLGASSSEAALPQLMQKLERLGAARSVVGLVVPAGYSFNLDGTNIYMTLATLFLAQATNTHLSAAQEASVLLVAMLTSKGATGVTGAGFITLAATLAVVPDIPVVSLAVLVGVDRFMSESRALTNIIGNGVATLVVARWEKALDRGRLAAELGAGPRVAVTAPAGGAADRVSSSPHP